MTGRIVPRMVYDVYLRLCKMSLNKKLVLSLAIIIAVIGAAFLFEHLSRESGMQKGAIIPVIQDGQPLAYMSPDVFKELLKKEYKQDTGAKGPSLDYVLASAGIDTYHYHSIDIKGLQKGSNTYRINQQEMNKSFVFYFTDRNTVNLVKLGDSPAPLVEDVSEIAINTKEADKYVE